MLVDMNHNARWLQNRSWMVGVAIALSLMGCEALTTQWPRLLEEINPPRPQPQTPASPVQSPVIADMESAIRQQINQIRQDRGLEALAANEDLAQVARSYSRQMAENNFFSHTGVDGSDVGQRVKAAGIVYWIVGENLFTSTNIPEPVPVAVDGWMDSPGHRENILRPEYRETGIGIWREGNTYYITQLFLRSPWSVGFLHG